MNRLTMPFSSSDDLQKVSEFVSNLLHQGVRFEAQQDFDSIIFTFIR
jgi:hypothetical protein